MGSTRLPGKPLADICGKPLIVRVLDGVSASDADRIVAATDSEEIFNTVIAAGYEAVVTGPAENGTQRVHEAWRLLGCPGERIINLQGDEPGAGASWVKALSEGNMPGDSVTTLARRITPSSAADPSTVKVVFDGGFRAMYFSRCCIPWRSDHYFQHVGVYCFTRESLPVCAGSSPGRLSAVEKLEQLSWMENGVNIYVVTGEWNGMGVDTPNDLEEARKWFMNS